MEIGGFITSGAEIVNHDNTLSGNGTTESPLGLNETVLWEGSTSASECILSESINNFELVDFYIGTSETPDVTVIRKSTGASEYALTLWFQNGEGQWIICSMGRYTVGNSGLSLTAKNLKHLWFNTTDFSLGGQSTNGPKMYKVVGINRKA